MTSFPPKVFFRCHPTTPLIDLKSLKNKESLVLWIHGGKFSPEETVILANKAKDAGIESALDLGQKTRLEKIHNAEDIKSSGIGKFIRSGSTIVLVTKEIYDSNLNSLVKLYPDSIIAQVNRLPHLNTPEGMETKINFGEGEVYCEIDVNNSEEGNYLFLTVTETKLGKLFSDHGVVGGTYSLEENRQSILGTKDYISLELNDPGTINNLILSFVTTKEILKRSLEEIERYWPGWLANPKNHIILKIETATAIEILEDLMTLDNGRFIYLIGLGDLGLAMGYKNRILDEVLNSTLSILKTRNKPTVIATGICLPLLPPDSFKVLPWPEEKIHWLSNLTTNFPNILAIGTTSEAIRASQRNILGEFLSEVRSFKSS